MPAVHHAASAMTSVMKRPTPMRSASATKSAVSHAPVRSPRRTTPATSPICRATAATTVSDARRSGAGESFGVTRYQWPSSIAPSAPPSAIAPSGIAAKASGSTVDSAGLVARATTARVKTPATVVTIPEAMRIPRAGRNAAMFDRIAPRYDLLNRLLSVGTDLSWRRRALDLARLHEHAHALDVGTGTGDFALALLARSPRSATVTGVDISAGMLGVAERRAAKAGVGARYERVIASVESLPFADSTFDVAVAGFVVRNVGDIPP